MKIQRCFLISVYAVDMEGRSSPMTHMEVRTSLLDTPQDVVYTKLTQSRWVKNLAKKIYKKQGARKHWNQML